MVHRLVEESSGAILIDFTLEDEAGSIYFSFDNIEQFTSRDLNALVAAEGYKLGSKPCRLTSRLNLYSASAKDDFLRSFRRLLRSDDLPIEAAFIEAIELLKEHLAQKNDVVWAENVKAQQSKMLFAPFLVEGAPSILFGKGGGAKTYLAMRLALSMATGFPFMGYSPAKKCKTLFIDYEDTAETFASRRGHLLMGEPILMSVETDQTICYLKAKGTPLPDLLPKLKKIVAEYEIGLIIIDSAVSACGGEPEKADVVARYFNSLATLGVTSLTIAHETKSENHAYPFGSVFWYNFPRSIWNVRSEKDDFDEIQTNIGNVLETGLFHRKANNGPIQSPIALRVTFDDKGEYLERVTFSVGDDATWNDEKTLKARIRKCLEKKPMTRNEIIDELPDEKQNSIDVALKRLVEKEKIVLLGTKGSPYILAKKSILQPIEKK